jgi:hypothetical protein
VLRQNGKSALRNGYKEQRCSQPYRNQKKANIGQKLHRIPNGNNSVLSLFSEKGQNTRRLYKMTVAEGLKEGSKVLREHAVAEPERESVLLMGHALKRDSTFIYAYPEYRLNAIESILFKAVVRRRAAHEPFQYIVGHQEFFGLNFQVTPDVLIPRPETEILVQAGIDAFRNQDNVRLLEVGVGSGCISVSILANLPDLSCARSRCFLQGVGYGGHERGKKWCC